MTRLKVAVRVRPLSEREIKNGAVSVVGVANGDTLAVTNIKVPEQNAGDSRERVRRFTFDHCFKEDTTQDTIFQAIETVIGDSVKQRFHSCVLAYGQSSSGKTHTMMGFPEDPGLTPKLCHKVFSYLQETAVGDELDSMKVSVSYLEIYNEKVNDLLVQEDGTQKIKKYCNLRIREHPKKGPYVQDLSEHLVSSSSELLEWLDEGNKRRKVAATLSNPYSSRSHAVFSINCDGVKLNLIDLAGSERATNRCFDSCRFKEGANINKSLVALGNVISALADRTTKPAKAARRRFVPYRDSVLTWLLKDTLGGNSNTFLVATVSPSSSCYAETVNTLRFGQRARLIVCERRWDVFVDPRETTIRELRAEIVRLKELLKGYERPLECLSAPAKPMNETADASSCNDSNSCKSAKPEEEFTSKIENQPIVEEHFEGKDKENKENEDKESSEEEDNDSLLENKENIDETNITTEKLLPLIDVNSSINSTKPKQLKRTFSVDRGLKMDREKLKIFGSNDSLPSNKSIASTPTSEKESFSDKLRSSTTSSQPLRRRSLTKAVPALPKGTPPKRGSLETDPKKIDKTGSTENLKKIAAKADVTKKTATTRPRSQIVAAVTSRLYSKLKKKEVATDTFDLVTHQLSAPKELSICSNARRRLQDITKKALKAHKNKNEETQTDMHPVLILKEMATDASDLRSVIREVKDASTMSELDTKSVAVDCISFGTFSEPNLSKNPRKSVSTECTSFDAVNEVDSSRSNFTFTRSCGTQINAINEEGGGSGDAKEKKSGHQPMSFTKYLRDLQQNTPNSPIYTHSVNINISNNYLNGSKVSTTVSDDSLEENVGLPTPDLISNHNSLEQHLQPPTESKSVHDAVEELEETFFPDEIMVIPDERFEKFAAKSDLVPKAANQIPMVNLQKSYAPELCVNKHRDEFCTSFPRFNPRTIRAHSTVCENLAKEECNVMTQPLLLKSIVKENNGFSEEESKPDPPDSFDYHMANKRVQFSEKASQEKRIIKAMSGFLEEATQLMNKIDQRTSKLFDDNFEVEVTINNARGRPIRKSKRRLERPRTIHALQVETRDSFIQTCSPTRVDNSTQIDNYFVPVNKYEALLEDTCRRLDEKIQALPQGVPRHTFGDAASTLDQNNSEVEDSSLESYTVTFSDYGSLPRKTHKRYRRPTCSPSAFLKQLTNMRKEIIKSSREDLMSGNCNH